MAGSLAPRPRVPSCAVCSQRRRRSTFYTAEAARVLVRRRWHYAVPGWSMTLCELELPTKAAT